MVEWKGSRARERGDLFIYFTSWPFSMNKTCSASMFTVQHRRAIERERKLAVPDLNVLTTQLYCKIWYDIQRSNARKKSHSSSFSHQSITKMTLTFPKYKTQHWTPDWTQWEEREKTDIKLTSAVDLATRELRCACDLECCGVFVNKGGCRIAAGTCKYWRKTLI